MHNDEDLIDRRMRDFADQEREIQERLAELDAEVLRPRRRRDLFVLGLVATGLLVGTLLLPSWGPGALWIYAFSCVLAPCLMFFGGDVPPLMGIRAKQLAEAIGRGGGLVRFSHQTPGDLLRARRVAEALGFELRGRFALDPTRAAPRIADARALILRLLRKGALKRERFARRFRVQDFVTLALEELEAEGVVVERDGCLRLTAGTAYRG